MSELPKMQAIELTAPGGPDMLVLREMPRPSAQRGELVIRVEAAGVNRPDILQRMGLYNPPPEASPLLGLEVSGVVSQVGADVTSFQVGDEVVALTNGGGYAEYVAVPAGQVLPLPRPWSMVEGATLPETLFTIQQTLIDRAGLRAGQNVLVHGGAGGIGATAIQMARLKGAIPFATVSGRDKANYASDMGAEAVINYVEEDYVARIKDLTGRRGPDVIVDIIGGDYIDRNLIAIAQRGTLIQLALLGGAEAHVNAGRLLRKHVTWFGSTLRPVSNEGKAAIAANLLRDVWPSIRNGRYLRPKIRKFPLAEVADAHRAMEIPEHYGKIVLVIRP